MTSRIIGTGGWAEVRVAKFKGLQVAAKCLHKQIISDYNRKQFTREMKIAAKLRHPNLLLFMGAIIKGEPVILTELMPTSLRTELESKCSKITRNEIISISRDVCCGLNYLHLYKQDEIIHRDISSANILLEPTSHGWRAKISDYGSANFKNIAISSMSIGPGCPSYAAPEAIVPSLHSVKMDIYSFGVVLVEMCVGEIPETRPDKREAQIRDISWPSMVSLCRECIREHPTDRPTASYIMESLDRM